MSNRGSFSSYTSASTASTKTPEGPCQFRRHRSKSFDNELEEFPPPWARAKWPGKHPIPRKPYLPGFLRGEIIRHVQEVDLGEFYLQKARRKRSTQPIRMLSECRAYYSQEYRLNMLRQALRKAMSDMDMGVTQYWALIDADGSGFLDREEFEGVMALSGAMSASSRHRRDSCPSHDDVGGFFFDVEAVRCSAQASCHPKWRSTRASSSLMWDRKRSRRTCITTGC